VPKGTSRTAQGGRIKHSFTGWVQSRKAGGEWPHRLIERRHKMHERLVFLSLMIVMVTAKVKVVIKLIVGKR
jgi:hypothetical protein